MSEWCTRSGSGLLYVQLGSLDSENGIPASLHCCPFDADKHSQFGSSTLMVLKPQGGKFGIPSSPLGRDLPVDKGYHWMLHKEHLIGASGHILIDLCHSQSYISVMNASTFFLLCFKPDKQTKRGCVANVKMKGQVSRQVQLTKPAKLTSQLMFAKMKQHSAVQLSSFVISRDIRM